MVIMITGAAGNLSSLLINYILENTNHFVVGIIRRSTHLDLKGIQKHLNHIRFELDYGDLADDHSIANLIEKYKPDQIYNLGGLSFVFESWSDPALIYNTNFGGTLRCLEGIRKLVPKCRYVGAGSSEQLAGSKSDFQTITTPPSPRNPYGGSKQAAFDLVKMYRRQFGLYAVTPIIYSNVSHLSSKEFVFPKVVSGLIKLKTDNATPLKLGYLEARRSWFSSKDCAAALWKMGNQEQYNPFFVKPKDYIISSGESRSVKDLVNEICKQLSWETRWTGKDLDEKLIETETGRIIVEIDSRFYFPENCILNGDSSPIRRDLGWEPKISFEELVSEMIAAETN